MKRFLGRYAAYVGGAYLVTLAYWSARESVMPGQQYPDPWLPCVEAAAIVGPAALVVVAYVGLIREYRAERRAKRKEQK